MKKCFSSGMTVLLMLTSMYAQVMEDTRVMSAGSQPALTIVLPGADTKFADSEWKDFMKSYGKITKVKKAKESVAQGVQILDIGGVNRLNVYHLSESAPEGSKMVVWIDMGGGFISSSTFPKEYTAAVRFLQDFAHKVNVDLIAIEVDTQKKALSRLESNLSKLQRDNDNLHKIIEDAKKRIAQAELDIVKNLQDQDIAQKEIENQSGVLDAVQRKLEETKARKAN